MAEASSRRSRFDQRPPSRDDRRSRSPTGRGDSFGHGSDARRRSRSPVSDKTSAAEAIARRIEAEHGTRAPSSASPAPPLSTASAVPEPTGSGIPQAARDNAGDYIKVIVINDMRRKFILTKVEFHTQIHKDTGAVVSKIGAFYPNASMATVQKPLLSLHIAAQTKSSLEQAVAMIEEKMEEDMPTLTDMHSRKPRRDERERDEHGRPKQYEARLVIGLEPIQKYNVRSAIVGQGGQNVKYIQNETRARVQVKGRGSGFLEQETNEESEEPMFLHITSRDQAEVDKAKVQAEGLLRKVREEYARAKADTSRQGYGSGRGNGYSGRGNAQGHGNGFGHGQGYGRGNSSYNSGGYTGSGHQTLDPYAQNGYGQSPYGQSSYGQSSPYGQNGYGKQTYGEQSPQGQPGQGTEQQAQSAASEDIYAPYGGYEAYCALYYAQLGQSNGGADGSAQSYGNGSSASPTDAEHPSAAGAYAGPPGPPGGAPASSGGSMPAPPGL